MKSRDEVSAGGVVYRRDGDTIEIVICKDAGYHRWALPKGLVDKNESYAQAAVREVSEETGVAVRVVSSLGEPEQYVYMSRGVRVFKRVYYFLMAHLTQRTEINYPHGRQRAARLVQRLFD